MKRLFYPLFLILSFFVSLDVIFGYFSIGIEFLYFYKNKKIR